MSLLSLVRVLEDVAAIIHIMGIHVMAVAMGRPAASFDGPGEGGGSEKDSRKERSCEMHIDNVAGLMEDSC